MRSSICMLRFCHWPESAPSSCVDFFWVMRKFAHDVLPFLQLFCCTSLDAVEPGRRKYTFLQSWKSPGSKIKAIDCWPTIRSQFCCCLFTSFAPPVASRRRRISLGSIDYGITSGICQTCPRVLWSPQSASFLAGINLPDPVSF